MLHLSTFKRGGVHPDDRKELSKNSPIEVLPVPHTLVVPMSQHLGAPAQLVKARGDEVRRGELIGQASSFVSANVHSPVRGKIVDVTTVRLANGATCQAAVIQPDEIQGDEFTVRHDWQQESPESLLATIREMGIVGMGGATFPTHVKLATQGKKVEALVINAVECEPYLTSDYRSMLERADETIEGIRIIAKILSPLKIIIGVEANKLDAAAHLEERLATLKVTGIEIQPLKMKYPQGDEKQLLKATMGREVPSGKLPIDIGAVVCNIGTVYAVWEAVVFRKPLIERVVTVSGEAVATPRNVLCPVGTRTGDLLAFCGGSAEDADRLISGGPMMGFAFADENAPVTKGTSGILALKAENTETGVCVSCGKCVAHCPMGLMPNRMFRNIKYGRYQEALDLGLLDCKECGCCAFICPAHLPLVQGFKLGKKMGRRK